MQLEFRQQHLSISAFPAIDLPRLAIVVGLNGSGKSHLLQAIASGAIANSVEPINIQGIPSPDRSPIRLIVHGTSLPSFGAYNSHVGQPNPMDPADSYEQSRSTILKPFWQRLDELSSGAIGRCLAAGEDLWRLGAAELNKRTAIGLAEIEAVFREAENELRQPRPAPQGRGGGMYFNEQMIFASAVAIADRLGRSMLEIQPGHLRLFNRWGEADQFSFNLAQVFGNYRDAWSRNKLLGYADGEAAAASLTDEEFTAQFGTRPWDEINKPLNEFSLPYEVTAPDMADRGQVIVQLRKTATGDFVSFENLSSGEKVLFQLALSTFQPDEFFLTIRRPKVLLLDEMDASLHPEMVHRWLGAIQRSLVEAQGMHCIITTHSPTTVALAPEQSLFEMVDGRSGLASVTKQAALNKLTFGVPTLSIDYSGRRQVFTESDTDAAIYEGVYALIKSHIKCERELNFLSTGLRDKDNGEINAGCTIVKQTVERLAELGNSSIFGIVDWDGEAVTTDRIKVVAGGERNGIENVLLDPLLVALLLMKERRLPDGLQDIDRFAGAPSLSPLELQRLIDAIQLVLFPDATDRVEVTYIGGAKGYVFKEYLEADDHGLEEALCTKFDGLKQWHPRGKGRGTLVKTVVEHVLSEHTCFCPVALPAVFEAIANAPA